MPRAQLSQYSDDVGATILCQRARNNFQSTGEGFVGPLMNAFDCCGLLLEAAGELHLEGAATRAKVRVHYNVASNAKSILQVALNLI